MHVNKVDIVKEKAYMKKNLTKGKCLEQGNATITSHMQTHGTMKKRHRTLTHTRQQEHS